MKRQYRFWLAIGLCSAFHAGETLAQTFEQAGVIQDVIVENNIIVVEGKRYKLPNSIQENGGPILFHLKQGQVVNFSGTLNDPEPIIESLTINHAAPITGEPLQNNAPVPQP